jgi:hypothetical protein
MAKPAYADELSAAGELPNPAKPSKVRLRSEERDAAHWDEMLALSRSMTGPSLVLVAQAKKRSAA